MNELDLRKPGDRVTFEGKVTVNPYGDWSDVDHGVYIGGERFASEYHPISDLEGKHVRVTVELLPTPKETEDDEAVPSPDHGDEEQAT